MGSLLLGCQPKAKIPEHTKSAMITKAIRHETPQDPYAYFDSLFHQNPTYLAKSFDYPVGKPDAKGYYNAQKFTENNHLGEDWNGLGGGNSDLGDPVYSIANGYVTIAKDFGGGWGNVIRIVHLFNKNYYESLYAHCDTIDVQPGTWVQKGDRIGTIGTADGAYIAHLHFELRDNIFMELGPGYASNTSGYLEPTLFINTH